MRLVYADEWAKSLDDSHPEGEALKAAVAQHWAEVEVIARTLAPVLQHVDQDMTKLMQWMEGDDSAEGETLAAALGKYVKWLQCMF